MTKLEAIKAFIAIHHPFHDVLRDYHRAKAIRDAGRSRTPGAAAVKVAHALRGYDIRVDVSGPTIQLVGRTGIRHPLWF